jgi:DNA-binding MarR family transcriptional regulator
MDGKIRDKIIQLVVTTKDQKLLEQVYNILDSNSNFTDGQLFDNLTAEQKEETELSLKESKETYNLEDQESVMRDIIDKFGWS